MAGTQLLSTLISKVGSGPPGSSPSIGICTGQFYYSANPNPNDPCAVYSPNGGQGQNLPTVGASGQSISGLLNSHSGNSLSNILSSSTESGGTASLTGGTGQNGTTCSDGTSCASGSYCSTVQPGQCIPAGKVDCGSYSCSSGTSCSTDGSMQCVPGGPTNLYVNDTSSSTPSASQTDLNQKHIPVPADGLHGDLLSFGGGVTVAAQSRSGSSEVSGFYGGQGGPAGLCQSRPWASNFLSYIIPPGFFDSLCTFAGYPAGASGSGYNGSSGGVQVIQGPGSPATLSQGAQSSTAPVAYIAASPPSVNLGGRTTVFWNSRNVSSCEEVSSDGNFRGSSPSGGASTVSLSGPVTFSISCLGLDGTQVQDSFTVNIGT